MGNPILSVKGNIIKISIKLVSVGPDERGQLRRQLRNRITRTWRLIGHRYAEKKF